MLLIEDPANAVKVGPELLKQSLPFIWARETYIFKAERYVRTRALLPQRSQHTLSLTLESRWRLIRVCK
jgi:hypothetical protein